MSVPWLPFSSPRSVAVLLSERCLSHQTSHDASCTEWSQARALPEALRWRESTRYLVRMQRSDNRDRIWAALTRGSPFRLVARGLAVAVVFAASGTLARHTDGHWTAMCVQQMASYVGQRLSYWHSVHAMIWFVLSIYLAL